MELKKGYKQTEVGVIPVDWDVVLIENIAEIKTGDKNTQDKNPSGRYPFFVRSQNVERIDSYSFDCEAVLTAGDGVGTGKVFHYINGKFDVHQRVYIINNFSDKVLGYYFFLYFSSHFYNRIMQMTAKSSVDSVRRDMIAEMPIGLPPQISEQLAISTALSDVDALLSSLDALIAKKRDIKTAVMQELLTGKKRLPGFSGSWKKAFAYEYGEFVRGVSYNPDRDLSYKNKENTFILLRANNINNNIINFSEIYYINKDIVDENQILLDGDILFCMSNGSKRLVGKSASYGRSFSNAVTFGAFMGVLRPNGNSNKSFLKYIFQTSMFISYINIILSGSAINNLTPANILNFDFLIPTDPEEQAAIATILSDMDAEIAALEARRAKVLALKQGMMQELLTGRTRLLPEGERHG